MINKKASWKLPYIDRRVHTQLTATRKQLRLRTRNSVISHAIIGRTIHIYNGQKYIAVIVKKEMVGHKIGEMSITKVLGFKPKKGKKVHKKGR